MDESVPDSIVIVTLLAVCLLLGMYRIEESEELTGDGDLDLSVESDSTIILLAYCLRFGVSTYKL